MLNFPLFLDNSRSFHGNTFSEKCDFTVIPCQNHSPPFFQAKWLVPKTKWDFICYTPVP